MAISKVGFVGVGNMGNPMAAHLVKAGFDVLVHDINPEASAKFVEQHGGRAAVLLEEIGRHGEVVITMLPTSQIVREAIIGHHGVASTLAQSAIVMDMSTSDPVTTQALAAALQPRGIAVVDAPVMGGVVFAKDGTLDIMVAGDAPSVERVMPVLRSMGRSVTPCGAVGSAHALKALGNYINACAMINVVEAMTIGQKFGLDAKFMGDALLPMVNGRQHPLEKKVIPQILTRKFATGMAMGLIGKDIGIVTDMAAALGAYAPLAECTHAQWVKAVEQFGAKLDQTEVAKLWEAKTGVTLKN